MEETLDLSGQMKFRAMVDPDGVLRLRLPVGQHNAGREVRLVITLARPEVSDEEYRTRIERLAGSIDDPTFVRPPQGECERRESME